MPDHLLGDLLKHVVDRRRRAAATLAVLDGLTARELEVFEIAARGADKNRLGEMLMISPATARTHVANIFKKLGINSRSELIALAASLGYEVSPIEPKDSP